MSTNWSTRVPSDDPLVANLVANHASAYRAQMLPIYLEPLLGSGERWTIAIVIIGKNETKVINAINSSAVDFLGEFGTGLFQIASESTANLKRWLTTNAIADWTPLFQGISVGEARNIVANDIESAARIAIKSFAVLMAKAVNNPSADSATPKAQSTKWENDIKREVVKQNERLGDMFGRNISINHKTASFSYRFGFVGGHVAANFANINPKNLNYAKRIAESDLMHLEQLRSHNQNHQLINHNTYELMIHTPDNMRDVYSPTEVDRVMATIEGLVAFGDNHEISVINFHAPQEAATRIIRRELSREA